MDGECERWKRKRVYNLVIESDEASEGIQETRKFKSYSLNDSMKKCGFFLSEMMKNFNKNRIYLINLQTLSKYCPGSVF